MMMMLTHSFSILHVHRYHSEQRTVMHSPKVRYLAAPCCCWHCCCRVHVALIMASRSKRATVFNVFLTFIRSFHCIHIAVTKAHAACRRRKSFVRCCCVATPCVVSTRDASLHHGNRVSAKRAPCQSTARPMSMGLVAQLVCHRCHPGCVMSDVRQRKTGRRQ